MKKAGTLKYSREPELSSSALPGEASAKEASEAAATAQSARSLRCGIVFVFFAYACARECVWVGTWKTVLRGAREMETAMQRKSMHDPCLLALRARAFSGGARAMRRNIFRFAMIYGDVL